MAESIVRRKSFAFALEIIELYRQLCRSREYVLSKQLLKSGTSIGANVEEALAAQSRRDFLAKMYIALKEGRETRYWLRLLQRSKLAPVDVTLHLASIHEILRLLSSITKTVREQPNQPRHPTPNS